MPTKGEPPGPLPQPEPRPQYLPPDPRPDEGWGPDPSGIKLVAGDRAKDGIEEERREFWKQVLIASIVSPKLLVKGVSHLRVADEALQAFDERFNKQEDDEK